jgi:hypothetical protein
MQFGIAATNGDVPGTRVAFGGVKRFVEVDVPRVARYSRRAEADDPSDRDTRQELRQRP